MFGKFSEQMKKSAQPAASLFEMNAKTLEFMSKQQTEFFSGVVGDSVKLLSALSDQTEIKGVIAAQSMYAESVRERLTSASKTTYSELNGLRAEMTDLVKNSLESVSEETKAAFVKAQSAAPTAAAAPKATAAKKATTKKAPAKKAATKKSTASAEVKTTPVAKAEPKASEKVTAKPAPKASVKPASKKASAKKAAPKAETKVTEAKATPATKAAPVKAEAPKTVKTESDANAEAKPATKSVAQLSPADVKATPKK